MNRIRLLALRLKPRSRFSQGKHRAENMSVRNRQRTLAIILPVLHARSVYVRHARGILAFRLGQALTPTAGAYSVS